VTSKSVEHSASIKEKITRAVTIYLSAGIMNKEGSIANDQEVLTLLRQPGGASRAIGLLYDRYADDVAALIVRMGGSSADGEDVFQEVVLAFVGTVQQDTYRAEAGVRTFLHALARHKWYNELRRRGRAQQRNALFEASRDELPESATRLLEHKEATAGLHGVLERIGASCKELLLGFYYGQRSMQELSRQLGLENEQVARNKKSRCLKKLTGMLEAEPALKQQLKNLLHGTE
jgi:RNA polymerase sigma factor (sigma-70 family)